MTIILNLLKEFIIQMKNLFLDMAPYIMLGATIAGLLHIIISKSFVARQAGNGKWSSVLKASLFGVPLPLCSCGVIPMATYLKKSGASRSSIVSFLISTPQTGIDSMVATYGMMGPFMALFRPIAAFISGIAGGTVAHFTDKKSRIRGEEKKPTDKDYHTRLGFSAKIKKMLHFAYIESISEIAVNFIIGLSVAAVLSMIIPDNFFAGTVFSRGLPAMLLMIVIGLPMYICSTSSIPVALTLLVKGFSPGAIFVFLMAGPATNAASLAVLSRILGKKQTAVFLGSVIVTSILGGVVLDNLIKLTGYDMTRVIPTHFRHTGEAPVSWFMLTVSIIFLGLLLFNLGMTLIKKLKSLRAEKKVTPAEKGTTVIEITGMTCKNCAISAKNALTEINGVENVEVNIDTKQALIQGQFNQTEAAEALKEVGYGIKTVH